MVEASYSEDEVDALLIDHKIEMDQRKQDKKQFMKAGMTCPVEGCKRCSIPISHEEQLLERTLRERFEREGLSFVLEKQYHVPLDAFYTGYTAHTDFAFPNEKVIVQVDGEYHEEPKTAKEDRKQDVALACMGWVVRRYTNDEVHDQIDDVYAEIKKMLADRQTNGIPGECNILQKEFVSEFTDGEGRKKIIVAVYKNKNLVRGFYYGRVKVMVLKEGEAEWEESEDTDKTSKELHKKYWLKFDEPAMKAVNYLKSLGGIREYFPRKRNTTW